MKDSIKYLLFISIIALFFTACSRSNTSQAKPFQYSALHDAVRLNQIDTVKLLVKDNPNIDKKDNFGDTPLIDAVRLNYTAITKVLICHDADTSIKDLNGLSLIDIAIRNGNNEIVKILKDMQYSFCDNKKNLKYNSIIDNNKTTDTVIFDTDNDFSNLEVNSSIAYEDTNDSKHIIKEDISKEVKINDEKPILFEPPKTQKTQAKPLTPAQENKRLNKLLLEEFSEEDLDKYINDTKTIDMDDL